MSQSKEEVPKLIAITTPIRTYDTFTLSIHFGFRKKWMKKINEKTNIIDIKRKKKKEKKGKRKRKMRQEREKGKRKLALFKQL